MWWCYEGDILVLSVDEVPLWGIDLKQLQMQEKQYPCELDPNYSTPKRAYNKFIEYGI